jgi:hypothetical protein
MAKKTNAIEIDDKTVYHFCGDGLGIPGLPHEVTAVQARALGLLEVLEAALRNGNYRADQVVSAIHITEKESD